MAEQLTDNTIETLARAIIATLAPISGARATGWVTVTPTASPVDLPRNAYLVPVIGGSIRHELLFKTAEAVTITGGGEISVPIVSNLGGSRHNLGAGTVFRFSPPVPGLELTARLDGSMNDGSDAGQLLRQASFFEDIDLADPTPDLYAARIGDQGLGIIWSQTDPVEGASAGMSQGSARARRGVRFVRETFVLHIVSTRLASDTSRRQVGQVLMQAITRLLTDRQQNDDGEQLSTVGAGVEIMGRARLRRSPTHYMYGIRLRVNATMQRAETRTFNPWQLSQFDGVLPGREAPEPTEPIAVVDAREPMP